MDKDISPQDGTYSENNHVEKIEIWERLSIIHKGIDTIETWEPISKGIGLPTSEDDTLEQE